MWSSLRPAIAALVGLSGCAQLTQVNVAPKTTLEHQLLGELEPLADEDELAASIRLSHGTMALTSDGTLASKQEIALRARQRQLFNRDDVRLLLAARCLGESRRGYLVERRCTPPPELATSLRQRLVLEENADRDQIVDWVVENDETLTPGDKRKVLALYARLTQDLLQAGMWYEDGDGVWRQKQP